MIQESGVVGRTHAQFQPSLFGTQAASFDGAFARVRRIELDASSWVELAEEWIAGADALFEQILGECEWKQRIRPMYGEQIREPRLTAPWSLGSGAPLQPPLLEQVRACLSARYAVSFDSVGFNLYRDGRDSVAWHRDRILETVEQPIIALESLGERRKFLLRPLGGGPSRAFSLGRGDLLVTGGETQRRWEHAVPKLAHAGPRISLAFRHGLDPRAYAHKTEVEPL